MKTLEKPYGNPCQSTGIVPECGTNSTPRMARMTRFCPAKAPFLHILRGNLARMTQSIFLTLKNYSHVIHYQQPSYKKLQR